MKNSFETHNQASFKLFGESLCLQFDAERKLTIRLGENNHDGTQTSCHSSSPPYPWYTFYLGDETLDLNMNNCIL